jgi:hypothetical protein
MTQRHREGGIMIIILTLAVHSVRCPTGWPAVQTTDCIAYTWLNFERTVVLFECKTGGWLRGLAVCLVGY